MPQSETRIQILIQTTYMCSKHCKTCQGNRYIPREQLSDDKLIYLIYAKNVIFMRRPMLAPGKLNIFFLILIKKIEIVYNILLYM